jgi:hypothetical protein
MRIRKLDQWVSRPDNLIQAGPAKIITAMVPHITRRSSMAAPETHAVLQGDSPHYRIFRQSPHAGITNF